MGISPRTRRLRTDLKVLDTLRSESTIIDFAAPRMHADAPDSYVITFSGEGLAKDAAGRVVKQLRHEVFIKLGANYPRGTPELAWRTPVFHPNISAGGAVCLGGYGTHWTPSLMLDELCTMLWDMIRYANFDVESPYNREAAHWAKTQSQFKLPLDARPIRDRIASSVERDQAPSHPAAPGQMPPVVRRDANGQPSINVGPARHASQDDVVFLNEEVVEAEIVEPSGRAEDESGIFFID